MRDEVGSVPLGAGRDLTVFFGDFTAILRAVRGLAVCERAACGTGRMAVNAALPRKAAFDIVGLGLRGARRLGAFVVCWRWCVSASGRSPDNRSVVLKAACG